jgi:transketolase
LLRKKIVTNKVSYGGYFLKSTSKSKLTIIATGSEVSLGMEVSKTLNEKFKFDSNVVSLPSIELFEKQSEKYKKNILGNKPRVIIEAASSYSWHRYLNKKDLIISLDTFGESGKAEDLFKFFGFNSENIVKLIKKNYL